MSEVLVPPARWPRWVSNFAERHGVPVLAVAGGSLEGTAPDGSTFRARLPFSRSWTGPADPDAFAAAATPPADWGVLLVRKGGFAVARLAGDRVVASKIGQRHVQGRTKAGGQSQQRFARRRDNQARQAYEAAAGHAARLLAAPGRLPVVVGGDHQALDAVLPDAGLRHLAPVGERLPVPDPRRAVLDQAVADACALLVTVVNAPG